jgi:hypothetical protein
MKKIEVEKLTAPLVLLILLSFCIELFLGLKLSDRQNTIALFLTEIVFLNSIHIGFSFFFFYNSELMRKWEEIENQTSSLTFSQKIIVVWLIGFTFQLLVYSSVPALTSFVRGSIVFYSFYHVAKQFLGYSLNQNHKKGFGQASELRKGDHFVVNALILLAGVETFIRFFAKEHLVLGGAIVSGLMIAAIGFWTYRHFTILKGQFRYKLSTLFRYMLFPLWPFSFSASAGMSILHGVEYFGTSHNLVSGYRIKNPSQRFKGALILFVVTILCLFSLRSGLPAIVGFSFPFDSAIWLLLGSFQITHYWFDGEVFKMRKKHSRELLAPNI